MNRHFGAALTIGFSLALLGAAPVGWDHKAVESVSAASRLVGGFSASQRRLYQAGLLHVSHQHQKPGQFTIRQIVRDERLRESVHFHAPRKAVPTIGASDDSSTSGPLGGFAFLAVILGIVALWRFGAVRKRMARDAASAALTAKNDEIHNAIVGHAERGDFPIIPVPINLSDDERCLFTSTCTYAVMSNVDHGSVGVGVSFRVARGVRLGTYHRLPMAKDLQMVSQDRGDLYLTTKRVVFVGHTTSNSFNWTRILKITPFVDGVRYEISNHRPIQFLTGDVSAALMSSILQRGLDDTDGVPFEKSQTSAT